MVCALLQVYAAMVRWSPYDLLSQQLMVHTMEGKGPAPAGAAAAAATAAAGAAAPEGNLSATPLKQQQQQQTGTQQQQQRSQQQQKQTSMMQQNEPQQPRAQVEGGLKAVAGCGDMAVATRAMAAVAGVQVLVVAALDDERAGVADAAKTVALLRKVQQLQQEGKRYQRGKQLYVQRQQGQAQQQQQGQWGQQQQQQGQPTRWSAAAGGAALVSHAAAHGTAAVAAAADATAGYAAADDDADANVVFSGADAADGGVLLRVVRGGHGALVGNNQESAIQLAFLIRGVQAQQQQLHFNGAIW